MNLDNSVRTIERENFPATVEVRTELKNALISSKMEKSIMNHSLIHATLILSVMSIKVRNQIHDSDVDRRIVSSQNFRNWKLQIGKITETQKRLKLVCIY